MYSAGEWVIDIESNQKIQIIEKIEVWGFTSYKVYNPVSGTITKLPESRISDFKTSTEFDKNYVKYITTLAKIKNEMAQGILSSLSNGIIPLPHQLHVLNRAVSDSNIRYILADEVGLGKTIEAGLIIKELKARGLVKRILVVCPKGLVTQWNLEMKEKFQEKFHVILPSDYDTIRKITDSKDVYGQFDQVISPMDSIKPLEKRAGWNEERIDQYNEDRIYSIINSVWDLIIIDEAHRVAGSSSEVSRYKLGNLLSKSSPYLLLLTATPHPGKTEPFLRLLGLLDKKAFPNFKALVKEQVAPFVIRTEKREAIDNDGNKLFKNRVTKVIEINWDERHSKQRELYELVTQYVRQGYNRAVREKKYYIGFLMVLMQRLVTSSTASIKESLEKRIEILENQQMKVHSLSFEDLVESDLEENLDEAIEVMSLNLKKELVELKKILEVAKQAEYQYLDAKVEKLLETLDSLYKENHNNKIIIFTEFVSTQMFLRTFLNAKGYKTSILNGSMDITQRNIVLNDFKKESDILISTDAGGEGLNLQFSNIVINYDLPWNPMKIEQRIGRVDRIGQKRDVMIFNFIISDTVENRIKNVLEEKLSVILDETGIDKMSDVLDNEIAELDFTEVYIQSIRNPKLVELNASKLEEDLKNQIKFQSQYKDIISEEKDLTHEKYEPSGFSIDKALREMMQAYANWKKDKEVNFDVMSINDPDILTHLNQEIEWKNEEYIPKIYIHNFPNESGYFALWELSINDDKQSKRIIPTFINSDFVVRPLSGKKIWDTLLKKDTQISIRDNIKLDPNTASKVKEIAQEIAYDIFVEMKTEYERRNEDQYKKYIYAIDLRIEAASKIGIENIRVSRHKSLEKEKLLVKQKYEKQKNIYPVFKPILMSQLEK